MTTNSITITYLTKVSFASLNGSDKEVDNINPIKKITLADGSELPYVSSQALRRAIRDRLGEMGNALSPVSEASVKKGAPKTALRPVEFIDDDLFGFMDASKGEGDDKGKSTTRTSPIRVDALLALTQYQGDLDFATNYMGKNAGAQPNIFETEIHSGVYRGSILIELDRVGCGDGFDKELSKAEKAKRVLAFIDAFRTLWSSGRQSRFLADISPKFIAAACMKAKNPIFLESVNVSGNKVNVEQLEGVVKDYAKFVDAHVFATQDSIFPTENKAVVSLGIGFETIENWVKDFYKD
jgi:CRISPR-associated protein Cst2